jgi:hypothetical protein
MSVLLLSLATLTRLSFGEIFGDLRLGDKYLADTKLTLKCGTEVVEGTTDKSGSFRLAAKASGKCSLTVSYDKQTPSVEVVVFDKPARYRFILEAKDGKYLLRRV